MTSKFIPGTKVGEPLPPFSVKDQNGQEVGLQHFQGSWLLLVFHRHLS